MFSNCGAGKDSWESFGWQGDQTSPSKKKSTLHIHWKDRCWSFHTLATWCEELIYGKRPWCWGRLMTREGDDRGWDGCIASLTRWTWVWANSRRWWRTGKLGVLSPWGHRVRQDWVTEQQWTGAITCTKALRYQRDCAWRRQKQNKTNSLPLEHRRKEKTGKYEDVIESMGSCWVGKSPKCQVRTLDWDLVKWGSTAI